jgi:hypothetical protein
VSGLAMLLLAVLTGLLLAGLAGLLLILLSRRLSCPILFEIIRHVIAPYQPPLPCEVAKFCFRPFSCANKRESRLGDKKFCLSLLNSGILRLKP